MKMVSTLHFVMHAPPSIDSERLFCLAGSMSTAAAAADAKPSSYARHTRYIAFGLIVAVIIFGALAVVGAVYGIWNRGIHIGQDSLTNEVESRVVEINLGSEGVTICSGVFIRSTGEILTAAHCFYSTTGICNFDASIPGYPMTSTEESSQLFEVEIMGVNGTGEKWTFPFEIVAQSPITDILIIKPLPLLRADGSVIRVVNQEFFGWDESQEVQRGDSVQGLSFDLAFLKKFSHKGPVVASGKDRGTSFAVSVEQMFVGVDVQGGASGSGFFNINRELVMAPLSYRWTDLYPPPGGGGFDGTASTSASGTSSRVSQPLTNRMLSTAPNGANNMYHIPSLGIIPTQVVSALNLYTDWLGSTYYPYLQNKGILFEFFATQGFFEYLVTLNECSPAITWNISSPAMLGAPLDVALSGTPPDPMIDFPGGGTYAGGFSNYPVILEAIELTPGRHNWQWLGEDAGLQTVTGILIGGGKWVGDVVRVKIRAVDALDALNPARNWEGIYSVTLKAIDPFYDSLVTDVYANYVSYIRVNTTVTPFELYLDPAARLPMHMRGYRDVNGVPRNTGRASMFTPIPDGVDIYALPTLAQAYTQRALTGKRQWTGGDVRKIRRASSSKGQRRQRRNDWLANRGAVMKKHAKPQRAEDRVAAAKRRLREAKKHRLD